MVNPVAAGGVYSLIWLVIALPLAGAALILIGRPLAPALFDRIGQWLAVGLAAAAFLLSLVLFITTLGRDEESRQVVQHLYTWFDTGGSQGLSVGFDLLYDQLSSLFLLLITGVGTLIHVYSVGYMADDERRTRFFGYLNLFLAAMLMLVLAENYIGLFLGWEGVGLASYLLIGFWQHKPSAAAAAKKAFVMNRVGDMGLALAIALCFVTFGTTSFSAINVGDATTTTLNWLGILLLLGACGKSAQVPLQGWLLDAMEGPTPVSALIHAATMVTAGVYLVVRSSAIFDAAEVASTAVVIVALVTIIWGAAISCVKDDIKKVLAGSTMSQIGYMMLAAGLGGPGYAFAIFHLLTHGFFKANMFLGAGSLMHGMNDDVNLKHYGALSRALPVTFVTFAMGYLAIIGFPGFAGFWSKDKILEVAFAESWLVGIVALLAAGVTAFYMTRLMMLAFFGRKRWLEGVHPHESPRIMTGPLVVLAALSVLGGIFTLGGWIEHWLEPAVAIGHVEHHGPLPVWATSVLAVLVVAIGVAAAGFVFGRRPATTAPTRFLPVPHIEDVVVPPGLAITRGVVATDKYAVDGVMSGGPVALAAIAGELRKAQTGYVRSYALSVLGGTLLVALALIVVN